jgi:hypothetical protein
MEMSLTGQTLFGTQGGVRGAKVKESLLWVPQV